MLEAPIDKYYATLILGILQIVGSSICVILVHYTGKRPLTFFSMIGGGICCILVAAYDVYIKSVSYIEKYILNKPSIRSRLGPCYILFSNAA